MAKNSKFKDNILLLYSFTVLLDRALMREFERVSQAIIDPAFKRKNSLIPEIISASGESPSHDAKDNTFIKSEMNTSDA